MSQDGSRMSMGLGQEQGPVIHHVHVPVHGHPILPVTTIPRCTPLPPTTLLYRTKLTVQCMVDVYGSEGQ